MIRGSGDATPFPSNDSAAPDSQVVVLMVGPEQHPLRVAATFEYAGATVRVTCDLTHAPASLDPDEVVAALAAVLRRSLPVAASQPVLGIGGIGVDHLRRTATLDGRPLSLTVLEFELLAYLVAHPGEVLSRDQLLENVWGYDIGGRDTVTVHVCRLRRKIEPDPSRPTLLQTVWGVGYRFGAPSAMAPAAAATNPVWARTAAEVSADSPRAAG